MYTLWGILLQGRFECLDYFSYLTFVFIHQLDFQTLEIDMLNKLGKEKMLYSVKVVKIDVNKKLFGDLKLKAITLSLLVCQKVLKNSNQRSTKMLSMNSVPGIYLYQCTPHKAMGMIGLVIVGNDKNNLEQIKKVKLRGKSKKVFKELLKEL